MVLIRYEVVNPYEEDPLQALLQVYNIIEVERTVIITDSDEATRLVSEKLIEDDHSVSIITYDNLFDSHGYYRRLLEFRERITRVFVMSYACYRFVRDQHHLKDLVASHNFLVCYDVDTNIARDVQQHIRQLHRRGYAPTTLKYYLMNLIS
jgi:hypothetical protein